MSGWYDNDTQHETLIDTLDEVGPCSAERLAGHLDAPVRPIRRALRRCEALGTVYHQGSTKNSVWGVG